ncbi:unannotated protein [freshwater metagenome]|uniref:Unannotated protein n=1 Tax=freshwater metagenome TaxID=449393 RepID=A0A6J6ZW59_9ZZZZ
MIKSLAVLVMAALLIPSSADAATKTPSPTAKATATPTPKATATKKAVIKKKVTTKKKAKNSLSPSPSPKWPPVGFKSNGEVYAKIPTPKELIGTASSSKVLTAQLAQLVDGVRICEKYSCGAVQIASLNGCTWWEVNAKLVGETSADDKTLRSFGTIRTVVKASAPRAITTVLLISQELLALKHVVTGISAKCHHDPVGDNTPSSTYTPVNN